MGTVLPFRRKPALPPPPASIAETPEEVRARMERQDRELLFGAGVAFAIAFGFACLLMWLLVLADARPPR